MKSRKLLSAVCIVLCAGRVPAFANGWVGRQLPLWSTFYTAVCIRYLHFFLETAVLLHLSRVVSHFDVWEYPCMLFRVSRVIFRGVSACVIFSGDLACLFSCVQFVKKYRTIVVYRRLRTSVVVVCCGCFAFVCACVYVFVFRPRHCRWHLDVSPCLMILFPPPPHFPIFPSFFWSRVPLH